MTPKNQTIQLKLLTDESPYEAALSDCLVPRFIGLFTRYDWESRLQWQSKRSLKESDGGDILTSDDTGGCL